MKASKYVGLTDPEVPLDVSQVGGMVQHIRLLYIQVTLQTESACSESYCLGSVHNEGGAT